MRTVDADKLLGSFIESGQKNGMKHGCKLGENWLLDYNDIKAVIDDAPTVEERPKGEWIHAYDDFYRCSLCGRGICTEWETEPAKYFPFCHCGANMRGENA